jgi:hypothetical protein
LFTDAAHSRDRLPRQEHQRQQLRGPTAALGYCRPRALPIADPELPQGRPRSPAGLRPFQYELSKIDRRTFENLQEWIELYQENKHDKAVLFLVGNKVDLPVREVSEEEAMNKAKELGVQYVETSAKTTHNI